MTTQRTGVPSEVLLVGEVAINEYRRLLINSLGQLQVDVVDRALRDLGLVDIGGFIPGSDNLAHNQVTVGAGATLIVAARSGRQGVLIVMDGAVDARIGNSGVTTGNGLLLLGTKGAALHLPSAAAVYGISTGADVAVSYMETY